MRPQGALMEIDRLCDDIGLDTIETGNAIGVAMEAGVVPDVIGGRPLEAFSKILEKGHLSAGSSGTARSTLLAPSASIECRQ